MYATYRNAPLPIFCIKITWCKNRINKNKKKKWNKKNFNRNKEKFFKNLKK